MESVQVMREDLHETFSPVAIRQRVQNNIQEKKQIHYALSPDAMKAKMHTLMRSQYGTASADPAANGAYDDAGRGGADNAADNVNLMACVAQFFEGSSPELLTCAMHAM